MNLLTLKIEIDLSKLCNTSNLFRMGLILSGPIGCASLNFCIKYRDAEFPSRIR